VWQQEKRTFLKTLIAITAELLLKIKTALLLLSIQAPG
jgi:hypothetical protein